MFTHVLIRGGESRTTCCRARADDLDRRRLLRRKLAVAQLQYLHVDDARMLGLGEPG